MAKIVLREKQERTLELAREAFREGHKHVMLYGPTGFGKTECAIALLKGSADKGKRAAMILDRIVLCEQTSERLQKYSIDHGVMQAGHWRNRPYEPIQVCSAQTLEKRGSFPGLNLLIVDEAHAQRRQTTEFIRNHPDLYVVGLSASPFAEGLGDTYTRVVSATTTEQLVEEGNLTRLRVFICKEVDMEGAKKVAGEWTDGDAAERGMKITGDVVNEWVTKTNEIFGGPRKTIVFCANVAHGADLAEKFAAAGYNFVPISYQDTSDFKRDAIKDFARPDSTIHGLISTDILSKGFDNHDVMIGVSARPFTKSFMSHVQQMGRVMRAHPADQGPCNVTPPLAPPPLVKPYAIWLDHSGNYLRFQEDWDDLYANGVTELKDGKEKPKKELTKEEKEARKCPACGALWVGQGRVCAACGHVRAQHNIVTSTPGVMEEVGAATGATKAEKQRWYSELLRIAQDRGYSEGWAAHKYKEKHGVWPRNLEHAPADHVSPEVARWETSRRIAWAKSKGKKEPA